MRNFILPHAVRDCAELLRASGKDGMKETSSLEAIATGDERGGGAPGDRGKSSRGDTDRKIERGHERADIESTPAHGTFPYSAPEVSPRSRPCQQKRLYYNTALHLAARFWSRLFRCPRSPELRNNMQIRRTTYPPSRVRELPRPARVRERMTYAPL